MKRNFILLLMVLLTLTITGCSYKSNTNKGSVGVERKQFMMIPSSEVNNGAKLAYANILNSSTEKQILNKDKKTLARLKSILNRLVPHTNIFKQNASSWAWEVNLIQSDQLNAWCMPGGKIAFYSGIIKKLKLTNDEIAAIMGHEMSHALREHGREQASREFATSLTISLTSQLLGVGNIGVSISKQIAHITFNLPNSREAEREADRMGIELSARAGYNPKAAIKVWSKMAKLSKNNQPEILSTHPIHKNRIKDLQEYSKIIEPLYIKAKMKYNLK